jgi:predicted cupin superfamily sugar epimerase
VRVGQTPACQHAVVEAGQLISALGMRPHPEGGHYAETWRGSDRGDGRSSASAIYFLLQAGERSHWHRVDADEIWLFHTGQPLELRTAPHSGAVTTVTLGPDVGAGHVPHAVVPANAWQAAQPLGDFTLVSCVVAPGFEFAGFELAPPGWEPA